jgi:hypothetical protein
MIIDLHVGGVQHARLRGADWIMWRGTTWRRGRAPFPGSRRLSLGERNDRVLNGTSYLKVERMSRVTCDTTSWQDRSGVAPDCTWTTQ